jgi:hypothetical protein
MKSKTLFSLFFLIFQMKAYSSELQPIQPKRVTNLILIIDADPNPNLHTGGKCALKGLKAKKFLEKLNIGFPFKSDALPASIITGNLSLVENGKMRKFLIYNGNMLYEDVQRAYFTTGMDLTPKNCRN